MSDSERLFALGAGPLGAVLVGAALVPLREATNAANLTFVFLALVILVAAHGGRAAAVATAVASALSLDFFLTQPYRTLAIAEKHDLIAFLGLAGCGLIAATAGAQRERRLERVRAAYRQAELLRASLRAWAVQPGAPALQHQLQALAKAWPVVGLVVRDVHDRALAATSSSAGLAALPVTVLAPDALLAPGEAAEDARPLPEQGGRLALDFAGRRLGWLDLWGDGAPADGETRRSISDLARLLAVCLAGSAPGSP